MQHEEYSFLLTNILPCKDRVYDIVIIQENAGQWEPIFSHILYIEKHILITHNYAYLMQRFL